MYLRVVARMQGDVGGEGGREGGRREGRREEGCFLSRMRQKWRLWIVELCRER